MNNDGTYTYTPPLDFIGTDVFNFTVEDTFGNSVNSTVTITVTAIIEPPTNFNGCIKSLKFFDRTDTIITLTWTASPTPNVCLLQNLPQWKSGSNSPCRIITHL